MSKVLDRFIIAASLDAVAEARIAARRRALADAERGEATSVLRSSIRRQASACTNRPHASEALEHRGGSGY